MPTTAPPRTLNRKEPPHAAERTQIRVNVALNLIDQADSPLKVRFAVAYAIGYIEALTDERLISLDGAGLYRHDALAQRRARFSVFGMTPDRDEP